MLFKENLNNSKELKEEIKYFSKYKDILIASYDVNKDMKLLELYNIKELPALIIIKERQILDILEGDIDILYLRDYLSNLLNLNK
jgi:hypothetical protein